MQGIAGLGINLVDMVIYFTLFTMLFLIIKRLLVKPLQAILEEREAKVKEAQKLIATSRDGIAAQSKEAEKIREEAIKKAEKIISEAKKEAQVIVEEARQKAKLDAKAILEDIERKGTLDNARIEEELERKVKQKAMQLVKDLVSSGDIAVTGAIESKLVKQKA